MPGSIRISFVPCFLSLICWSVMTLGGSGVTPVEGAELDGELQRAGTALGSANSVVRTQATRRLLSAGRSAVPILESAAESENLEAVDRACRLLLRLARSPREETADSAAAALRRLTRSRYRHAAARARSALPAMSVGLDFRIARLVLERGGQVCIRYMHNGSIVQNLINSADAGDDCQNFPETPWTIVRINLCGSGKVDRGFLRLLSKLPSLEVLVLAKTPVADADVAVLRGCSRIDYLNLRETRVTQRGADELRRELPRCVLRWGKVVEPGAEVAEWVLIQGGRVGGHLADGPYKERHTLTSLPLTSFDLKMVDASSIPNFADADLAFVCQATRLRDLRLARTAVTDGGLKSLSNLEELVWLDLQQTHLGDAGLDAIPKKLPLCHVSLARTQITSAGLTRFLAGRKLETLSVAKTAIDDGALVVLARQSELWSLNLAETQVTFAGLKHLAQLKNLDTLNLKGISLTETGLLELVRIPTLRSIVVSQSVSSSDRVRQLQSTLPDLLIVVAKP